MYGVVGKSLSHHHRHSAWQRTELKWVYKDIGMTEMDRAMGADGDTGVKAMVNATGSIVRWPHGRLTIIASCISSYHTMNYTLNFPLFWSYLLLPRFHGSTKLHGSSRLGGIISSHPHLMLLEPEQLFRSNSCRNAARGVEDCLWWTHCLLALRLHHKWRRNPDSVLESWLRNRGKESQ